MIGRRIWRREGMGKQGGVVEVLEQGDMDMDLVGGISVEADQRVKAVYKEDKEDKEDKEVVGRTRPGDLMGRWTLSSE